MKVSAVIAHQPSRGDEILQRCVNSLKMEGIEDIVIITRGNRSEARNEGVKLAKHEIIAFFDDDVELREGCMKELLRPFGDPQVAVCGGVNIAFDDLSFEEQIGGALLSSKTTMMKSAARYTPIGNVRESDESELILCNMAIRKDIFEKVGGLPVGCIPNEENVLINNVQKMGYKVIYNPFAVVFHNRRPVFLPYFKSIFWYGYGRGLMIRKFGREGRPKMFFKPSKRWLYLFVGTIGHYISYVAGLIWGLLKGK